MLGLSDQSTADAVVRGSVGADGYAVVEQAINGATIAALIDALSASVEDAPSAPARAGLRRAVESIPEVAALAGSRAVRTLVEPVLGPGAFVVRSIVFDKSAEANWDVPWHQDTTIAVRQRRDLPGFGPWSVKAGVVHVRPPARVLERMITIRIHLDPCGPKNGPLLVVPGSHQRGMLAERDIDPAACARAQVACTSAAGGAVLMRPLLLHASRKAARPSHRRVIHLEFAAEPLPAGLEWAASGLA